MLSTSFTADVSGHVAPSAGPTLTSRDLDCIDVPSQFELQYEVVATLLSLFFGFVFGVFPLRAAGCRVRRARAAPPTPPQELGGLPLETIAEVARCLPLKDLAAVSAASDATWRRLGLSAEAWHLRATDSKLDLVGVEPLSAKVGHNKLESHDFSRESREAFRRRLFHIDGPSLVDLGCAHAATLTEAAYVARGLMPYDGEDALESTCLAAERALQAHNPAIKAAASAASEFLQVVRRRQDIISTFQMERLESAYSSALQLQALMDGATDGDLDALDAFSDRSEAPSLDTPPSTSPRLPTVEPADEEDIHEMRRHCELDALLEELCQQTVVAGGY